MLEPIIESQTPEAIGAPCKRTADQPPSQPMTDLPDLLLVERARGKDARAFETLMRRYNRRLFRIARSVIADDQAAESVVQEAYLLAFTDLERYEPAGKFGVWLARLAFNQALALRRSVRPTLAASVKDPAAAYNALPALESADSDPLDELQVRESLEEAIDEPQARESLEEAIDELPEVFRPVYMLRAVEKVSGIETAACLGLNQTTVRTRFFRAQRRLHASTARRVSSEGNGIFDVTSGRSDRIVASVFARLNGLAIVQESA